MSCKANESFGLGRLAAASVMSLALAACASTAEPEPVTSSPAPPPPPPSAALNQVPPPIYRVRSGTPSVLERFPRGSVVTEETEICLEEGEQVNVIGDNGQSVTYVGPGCMARSAPATGDNEGGFIFGSNEVAVPEHGGVLAH